MTTENQDNIMTVAEPVASEPATVEPKPAVETPEPRIPTLNDAFGRG